MTRVLHTALGLSFVIALLSLSCVKENPTDPPPCPWWAYDRPLTSPYSWPIWHPNGNVIGFNMPLGTQKEISYPDGEHCPPDQVFQTDSAGFWLVNVDGTNKRRLLSGIGGIERACLVA